MIKILLLSAISSTSLLVANSLQVVSCKRKAGKESKENEKSTEQVESETATKIMAEITNIIDETIANPVDSVIDEWIIKLDKELSDNYNNIIKSLNAIIDTNKKNNIKQFELSKTPNLDEVLLNAVKMKFNSLRDKIVNQIINNQELGQVISDFKFNFEEDSISPFLTNLDGVQFISAFNKLKALKNPSTNSTPYTYYIKTKDDEANSIDLFKVMANLKYSFSFGNTQHIGEYKECELFLTGNIDGYRKIKKITQTTIKEILNEENTANITIYNDKKQSLKNYYYMERKMDWDFSKVVVRNEIKELQYDKISELPKLKDIKDQLTIKKEDFDFKPLNYMNFSNYDLHRDRGSEGKDNENCMLVCKSATENDKSLVLNKKDVIGTKAQKQYGLDEHDEIFPNSNWDGGQINKKFIEQLKQDGEGDKPVIDFSNYYGVGAKATVDSFFLVGYGETTIKKVSYADMQLGKINVKTHLVIPYNAFTTLFANFRKYVETLIAAIWNEENGNNGVGIAWNQYSAWKGGNYITKWVFDNPGEWEIIEKQLENNGGSATFNWIMDNVLLEKRIKNGPYKQIFPKDTTVLSEAQTSLQSEKTITYIKDANKKGLVAKEHHKESLEVYIKYGPFKLYLTDIDSIANFVNDSNPQGFIGISSAVNL